MKVRHLAMAIALVGGISFLAVTASTNWRGLPTPEALRTAAEWAPEAMSIPVVETSEIPISTVDSLSLSQGTSRVPVPNLAQAPEVASNTRNLLTSWSRKVAAGETLDALLKDAGLTGSIRAEAALAIGAEYDLRRLRPGHALTVNTTLIGTLHSVSLGVDDGVVITAEFGDQTTISTLNPDPEDVILAGETVIESSLFGSLEDANIPARFAVDMAQMLGGTVDFRRELQGGETLQVLWREARLNDTRIGEPEITFAALDLGDVLYEVVWPDDGTGRATIYVNGEVLRVFAQPVDGARLSSVFGQRRHPIYGNVRMHTGVDFAAPMGTPVHSTAPGQVSFVGWRGGYGRVVEIAHGADTMTRYTHLSAYRDGLAVGQRVSAGDVIGKVGASGTATGPNMHYEVRIDGRPIDPLSDERLAAVIAGETQGSDASTLLAEVRTLLATTLTIPIETDENERL